MGGNGKGPLKVRDYVFAHLAEFALDGEGPGLTVIPGQTGSGKTFAAAAVACAVALGDASLLWESNGLVAPRPGAELPERLIYLTPLKKNRDAFVGEMHRFMQVAAGGDARLGGVLAEAATYVVESAIDVAVGCVVASGGEGWPPELREHDSFLRLDNEMRVLRQVAADVEAGALEGELAKLAKEDAENRVRAAERELRSQAKLYLARRYREEVTDKGIKGLSLAEWARGGEFDWLRAAWPSASTFDKSVFVMTPDKFMTPHDTIVAGSFTWATARGAGQILDGAMVIVDESDTTYGRMLDRLIEQAAKGGLDPVDFTQKLAHVKRHGFEGRDELVTGGGEDKARSAFTRFDNAAAIAARAYDEFGLASNFKLAKDLENKSIQLFSDGVSGSIRVDGGYKRLVSRPGAGKNWICVAGSGDRGLLRVEAVLKSVRGVTNLALKGLLGLAFSLQDKMRKRAREGDDEATLSLEQAIGSVLSELHIADADKVRAAVEQLAQGQVYAKRSGDKAGMFTRDDLSIYAKGISLIDFKDDKDKSTMTCFNGMELRTTPEAMLCGWADRCKVALVSATAGLPQLHNFHLPYVYDAVDRVFDPGEARKRGLVEVNNSEKDAWSGSYEVEARVYGKVDATRLDAWVAIDRRLALPAREAVGEYRDLPNKNGDFCAQREWRVVSFIKDCLDMGIMSALIFNTASAGDQKEDFSIRRIGSLCQPLLGEGEEAGDVIVGLDARNWEKGFAQVKADLAEGKRRYVVLAYATAGAGLNPQYRIGEADSGRVRPLPGCEVGDEKDFEAVFLGRPTNMYVHDFTGSGAVEPWRGRAALLKGLWEQGVLHERGEIASRTLVWRRGALAEAYAGKRNAFRLNSDGSAKMEELPSVRGEATKIVNQAVGRITRTGMKAARVLVGVDGGLVGLIDCGLTDGEPTSREWDALAAAVRSAEKGDEKPFDRYPIAAARVNRAAVEVEYRQALRRSVEWAPSEIEARRMLWDAYLRHPTATEDEWRAMAPIVRRQGYIELPSPDDGYWYKVEGDDKGSWRDCDFCFEEGGLFESWKRMDERLTLLPELMRSPVVRGYFEREGYATRWEPGRYIIPAGMVHNAYMGALGEAAARAWLESCMGLEEGAGFGEMPGGLFEMFDIYLPGLAEPIYLDAKNWHDGTPTEEGYVEQVLGKLADCGRVSGREGGYAVLARACGGSGSGMRTLPGTGGRVLEIPRLFDAATGAADPAAIRDFGELLARLSRKG